MTEGRALRTWRERVAAPLKPAAMVLVPEPVVATPTVAPAPRPRLEQIGPTTWVLADWAKALCVFCPEPLGAGDKIACVEHRRQMDAEAMQGGGGVKPPGIGYNASSKNPAGVGSTYGASTPRARLGDRDAV